MKQSQINQKEMYEATNSFLDLNSGIWNPIPVINTYKTRLVELIQSIDTAAGDQEAAQVFIGSSVNQLKRQISVKLDMLDDILAAYAEDTGNDELFSKSNNSISSYFRLPHEDFTVKSKNIVTLLEQYVPEMTDYGLSTEQIEETKVSIDLFQTKRSKPRAYQVESRVATTDLEELFKEGNKVLSKMDKVLKRFKRSNPSFYTGYEAARMVINEEPRSKLTGYRCQSP